MTPVELREFRRRNNDEALRRTGWYHSFRFPDGSEASGWIPLERLQHRFSKFPIPANLTGKRVLDIGTWDGWFAFEAERRGAAVTAIDLVEQHNFLLAHEKLGSQVRYLELDIYGLPNAKLGSFDYVFFLGVLYHLKHPILALECVYAATKDIAIVESYVTDQLGWRRHTQDIPTLEFYETDELGGNVDNWFGPTVACLQALCRTAGFARVEVIQVEDQRCALACHRRWEQRAPDPRAAVPIIRRVANAVRFGLNFRTDRDEFVAFWFDCEGPQPTREEVRIEIDDLGLPTIVAAHSYGSYLANCRLPVGIEAGWHNARIQVRNSRWSEPVRIAVDTPLPATSLKIDIVCDSGSWERDVVQLRPDGSGLLSVWISGLAENADEANTHVSVDGIRLQTLFVGQPDDRHSFARQLNTEIKPGIAPGEHSLTAHSGNSGSPARTFWIRAI